VAKRTVVLAPRHATIVHFLVGLDRLSSLADLAAITLSAGGRSQQLIEMGSISGMIPTAGHDHISLRPCGVTSFSSAKPTRRQLLADAEFDIAVRLHVGDLGMDGSDRTSSASSQRSSQPKRTQ
jgi:hypothetical protein